MDVRRQPARERPALGGFVEDAVLQQIDRQPRATALGTAPGAGVRHLPPYFAHAPRLVQGQLVAPHIGGVVHFHHHVRRVVAADEQAVRAADGAQRSQVDDLIRVRHAPRRIVPPRQQPGAAEAFDRRAAHRGDALDQLRQRLRRRLVLGAGTVAQFPGGLGFRVPELQPASAELVLLRGHREGAATGEGHLGERRFVAPRDGQVEWRRGAVGRGGGLAFGFGRRCGFNHSVLL